jgi:hypothetical protein
MKHNEKKKALILVFGLANTGSVAGYGYFFF